MLVSVTINCITKVTLTMTMCVIVNCLIVSTLNYQQKWQLLKSASFTKNISATIICTGCGAREGERERENGQKNKFECKFTST